MNELARKFAVAFNNLMNENESGMGWEEKKDIVVEACEIEGCDDMLQEFCSWFEGDEES